jgi:hypothetical protein
LVELGPDYFRKPVGVKEVGGERPASKAVYFSFDLFTQRLEQEIVFPNEIFRPQVAHISYREA